MNKSKRIYADIDNPAEKNIKIKLEQDTNFVDILSLRISQKEAYQFFNADYGVLVGRVIANGGVGIPNAKVSIFIPITDEDKQNPEIYAAYPYENPRNKNLDNKRYNLLPRVAKENPDTGAYQPKQPFGSFPTKEEIITNETWLEVYEKYYKYSTVTNNAGDYMLFGVPTGVQTVHMSVDITDIGDYSMTPAYAAVGILSWILLSKSKFGRYVFAIGGNMQAARICGINVERTLVKVYAYAGFLSAISGILLVSRTAAGNPTYGLSYELDAIASTVIGGTSLSGGIGSIPLCVVGALIIGVLNNGMDLLGVNAYWQQIVKGLIIVVAVLIDARKQKRK